MRKKTFYRVEHLYNRHGFWYNKDSKYIGNSSGLLSRLSVKDMPMPFTKDFNGFYSAVAYLRDIKKWFTKSDLTILMNYGYKVTKYISKDYREIDGHWLISIDNSTRVGIYD